MAEHLANAKKLKEEFKVKEAADEFEKALTEDRNSIEAAGNAGLCHMMLGQLDKAGKFFDRALEINGGDTLVALYRSMIDVAQGKPYRKPKDEDDDISISEQFMTTAEMLFYINLKEEAFKLFEAVLGEIKDDSWLNLASNQYRIVTMLARFGFYAEAKNIADALVAENPKAWHGYAAQAQVELEQDRVDDSKALFKQAMLLGGAEDPLLVAALADTRLLKVSEKDFNKK